MVGHIKIVWDKIQQGMEFQANEYKFYCALNTPFKIFSIRGKIISYVSERVI